MNIRTRMKTPFNAVYAIEPKPSVKPFAGKDESELLAAMMAQAEEDGHKGKAPKTRGGGETLCEGSLSHRVLTTLSEMGSATTEEVHSEFPEHTKDRISKTLGDLKRRKRAVVLEQKNEGTRRFNVWGLA